MPLARRLAKELLPDWIEHNLKYKVTLSSHPTELVMEAAGTLANDEEFQLLVAEEGVPGGTTGSVRPRGRGLRGFRSNTARKTPRGHSAVRLVPCTATFVQDIRMHP